MRFLVEHVTSIVPEITRAPLAQFIADLPPVAVGDDLWFQEDDGRVRYIVVGIRSLITGDECIMVMDVVLPSLTTDSKFISLYRKLIGDADPAV